MTIGRLGSFMRACGRVHAKMGDFWWYSMMIFLACRAADLLNAFVGLWLVPKYVDPEELGAILPLANFANFVALPVGAFAATFRNEVSRLASGRELGKLKTLMKGVFIAAAAFLFVALALTRFVLPAYMTRLRIVEGSLGTIIVFSSFVGVVSPIFGNALQSLKRFRSYSLISVVSAPIRLVAMLVAMPLRAISGYFVGQTAPPAFSMLAAVFFLRKDLSVKAEPYWTRDVVRRFAGLFAVFAASGAVFGFTTLVESTVLRQRLPALDSAAYYMVTRFSDIANFLSTTLAFTIFPFAADAAARNGDTRPLVVKASLATAAFGAALAAAFGAFGARLMSVMPHGSAYAAFAWAIPCLIGINVMNAATNYYTTVQTAACRFGFLKLMLPLNLLYAAALLFVTGHGYFSGILPPAWTAFLDAHPVGTLEAMVTWMAAFTVSKLLACAALMALERRGGGNGK